MSTTDEIPEIATTRQSGTEIIRRGLALSPAIKDGLGFTILLAMLSTVGGSVIPVLIQRTVDSGLGDGGDVSLGDIGGFLAIAGTLVLLTAGVAYWMRIRLFIASETGLAQMRVDAFRHVHDLSMLTQNSERRGVLVSRVTSDIDQVSQFLQFTGIQIVVSLGQIVVATAIMAYYSWQLTLVVLVCFLPLAISLRWFAQRLSDAYDIVRRTVGEMIAVIAEPVVGASVVRRSMA
jgi:ATP-binding cassette subfamily B protein